jgi:hypothetical protein
MKPILYALVFSNVLAGCAISSEPFSADAESEQGNSASMPTLPSPTGPDRGHKAIEPKAPATVAGPVERAPHSFAGVWTFGEGSNAERIAFTDHGTCRDAQGACRYAVESHAVPPSYDAPWTMEITGGSRTRSFDVVAFDGAFFLGKQANGEFVSFRRSAEAAARIGVLADAK